MASIVVTASFGSTGVPLIVSSGYHVVDDRWTVSVNKSEKSCLC